MESKIEIKNIFTEVHVILNELKLYDKIPNELKELIEYNLNNKYEFNFNKNIPLFNQVTNQTTRNLLTYIYINYINNNNKFLKNEIDDILNQ